MKCDKCGQELKEDMKFCINCGSPVEVTLSEVSNSESPALCMVLTTSTIPGYRTKDCFHPIFVSVAVSENIIVNDFSSLSGSFGAMTDVFRGGIGSNKILVKDYDDAYQAITKLLIEKALQKGCNAIIGLRYQSQIIKDYFFLTAYGTACTVEKE